jgi:hypothetical protein
MPCALRSRYLLRLQFTTKPSSTPRRSAAIDAGGLRARAGEPRRSPKPEGHHQAARWPDCKAARAGRSRGIGAGVAIRCPRARAGERRRSPDPEGHHQGGALARPQGGARRGDRGASVLVLVLVPACPSW